MENADYRARLVFRCGGVNTDVFLDNINVSLQSGNWINSQKNSLPGNPDISNSFPNPFNQRTCIWCTFRTISRVEMELINMQGQIVSKIYRGVLQSGSHRFAIEGGSLATGVYFCRTSIIPITGDPYHHVQKIILMK